MYIYIYMIWVCSQLSCRPRFSSIQEAFLQSSQVSGMNRGNGPTVLWDALIRAQSWAFFATGITDLYAAEMHESLRDIGTKNLMRHGRQ